MKVLKSLVALALLSTVVCAGELTEADKKWSGAVEKMIAEGNATISTPSESRVQLAKELAARHGRQCQVEKTSAGYKIVIQSARLANTK